MLAGTVLALASFAWGTMPPVRALPQTAQRFICYMDAMEKSGQDLGLWDRITYSLVLAGPNPKVTAPPSRRSTT